jgi:hypothetical protein
MLEPPFFLIAAMEKYFPKRQRVIDPISSVSTRGSI